MNEFVINKIRGEGDKMVVTIPKKSNFKIGEYAGIIKVSISDLFYKANMGLLKVQDLQDYDSLKAKETNSKE